MIVHESVVEATEGRGVVEGRRSTVFSVSEVVDVAVPGVGLTAREHATPVAGGEGATLGEAELLGCGVGVEDVGPSGEERRDESGVAQQLVCGGASDAPLVAPEDQSVEVVDRPSTAEGLQVDVDVGCDTGAAPDASSGATTLSGVGSPDADPESFERIEVGMLPFDVEVVAAGRAVEGVLGEVLFVLPGERVLRIVRVGEVAEVDDTIGAAFGESALIGRVVGVRVLGPTVQGRCEGLERRRSQVDMRLSTAEETAGQDNGARSGVTDRASRCAQASGKVPETTASASAGWVEHSCAMRSRRLASPDAIPACATNQARAVLAPATSHAAVGHSRINRARVARWAASTVRTDAAAASSSARACAAASRSSA